MSGLLFDFPNVTTEGCFIFITFVSEWFRVIVIPLLPFIFWYVFINSLWFSWCWCYALIMNVFHSAFPLHRTIFFLSAITWKFWIFHWLEYVLIVAAYYLRNIFCATITYLTNLGWNIWRNLLFFGKCLSKSFKKILATLVTRLLL